MGKRLYVGNLPYDADEAAVRSAFSQDGCKVERVHIPLDRETQRPRGFAFVEMATDEDARKMLAAMDGAVMGTRNLRVSEAEDRRPTGPGGPRGPGGGPRVERVGGGDRPAGPRPDGFSGAGRGTESAPRPNRFGPDAKPRREREAERRAAPRRRTEVDDDAFGGRRGRRRFDEDDDE